MKLGKLDFWTISTLILIVILVFITFFGPELSPLIAMGVMSLAIIIGGYLTAFFFLRGRLKNISKEEWTESISEGAIEESQILRDLTETETVLLQRFYNQTKNKKYYYDLRSPVFSLSGKLTKRVRGSINPNIYRPQPFFFVRGLKITPDNNSLINIHDESLKENDEVKIEHSPRSKYIWKMYKIEDI